MKKANTKGKNGKGNGKKNGPYPKYRDDYARMAEIACREGAFTDKKLAKLFDVHEATIYRWKHDYPTLCEAIKRGKDDFNIARAENSLIKRLLGYTYTETTRELVSNKIVVTKKVRKKIAADPTCLIFFLKNRDPKRWRDVKDISATGNLTIEICKFAADEDQAS